MNTSQNSPTCRHCTNSPLHESRSQGLKDGIMKCLKRHPMRCHRCGNRYYLSAFEINSQGEAQFDEVTAPSN